VVGTGLALLVGWAVPLNRLLPLPLHLHLHLHLLLVVSVVVVVVGGMVVD
jgi:hypothetical protein